MAENEIERAEMKGINIIQVKNLSKAIIGN
jgi:hypothetical protein